MKKEQDYYIGLDIGTSSVGWAVTDEAYRILKFNGKKMWGVRLFDEGETAQDRRGTRSSRRRLNRRRERIDLLQELLAEEISKKDKNFFLRLDNSDLYRVDKDEKLSSKFSLFNDKDFKDKDYHHKYPTVHHLIMDLIEDDSKKDVRLLYLACHYLLKNRGHFIFEGKDFDTKASFKSSLDKLKIHLYDKYNTDLEFNNEDVIRVLSDDGLNKTEKKKKLELVVGKDSFLKAINTVMVGGSQNLAVLFNDEELKEGENKKIDLSTTSFDEKYSEYEEVLGERIELLNILKEVYDASILEELLKESKESKDGNKYISTAFTSKYEKHGEDLKKLKALVKKYISSDYNEIFRDEKVKDNYVSYTKSTISNSERKKALKFTNQEDFYKYIKKKLEKITEGINDLEVNENIEEDRLAVESFIKDMELKKFMPKIKSSDNGVIPYQLKYLELKKILENQAKYHDFLNKGDEYGTVSDKILSIMKFRIPYYVGPLNPASEFAWIKRKEGRVKPWNFEELVDLDASREEFIDRLIGRCSFLKEERVLPKSSLLYTEYMVLNELNNLKVNAQTITGEMKKLIFEELFKTKKKVTLKAVTNLLKKEYNLPEEIILSGVDGDFKHGLNSYHDFKKILGDRVDRDDYREKIEDIIKRIVLYSDDKSELSKKIKATYGEDFTSGEIKKMSALTYKDWGRLSKKLLIGVTGQDKNTGESGSIIHFMREYNLNLMELMSGNFNFNEKILALNPIYEERFSYDLVEDLYLSPAVKRMLWQSLKIVEEVRKIEGKDPKKIFIEMTRSKEDKKQRKESRKKRLEDFYKDGKKAFIKELGEERYNYLLEGIKSQEESKFRWDDLYLYYTQLGRCMYSLEPIDLSKLSSKNTYDQDHIYPKSKIYDDSIANRVLVKKDLNNKKKNTYPIPEEVLNKNCYSFWKMLYDKKLIDKKKYTRLIRRSPFTDDELGQFIERQVVETGQATKETANLLKVLCKDSEIVYSKATNVSKFRQEFDILKCRTVNDLHHMHDAYLNVVVGNVYSTKFTKDPRNFIKNGDRARGYNLENMFRYDVKRGNYTAWIADSKEGDVKDATIKRVKKELQDKNYRLTRMTYIGSGVLFDQNLLRKGHGQIPQKENTKKSDIEKYGGYNKASTAYFTLVESDGDKGKEKTIETIPILIYNKKQNGVKDAIIRYLEENLGLKNPVILLDKIKINSLIKLNGFFYNITGKTGNRILISGSVPLILSYQQEKIIRKIDKFLNKRKNYKDLKVSSIDGIEDRDLINLYESLSDKLNNSIYSYKVNNQAKNIKDLTDKFKSLDIEDKIYLISQLLLIFQKANNGVDLRLIGLSKNTGKSRFSKKINYGELKLINQSITGLFENEVDLLKL